MRVGLWQSKRATTSVIYDQIVVFNRKFKKSSTQTDEMLEKLGTSFLKKRSRSFLHKNTSVKDGRCIHHLRYPFPGASGTFSDLKTDVLYLKYSSFEI